MKEKKARVEDALHATRAAVEEGIVPGGGVALIRCLKALEGLKVTDDEQFGVNIVRRALEEPLRQIAQNAGVEGSIVVNKVKEGKGAFGFNAATGDYEDLVKAGVIDPTKVVRTALQNAASVASLMLTTEAMIAEKPKEEPGGGGGGMGGMGGIGGRGSPPLPPATSEAPPRAVFLSPAGGGAAARHPPPGGERDGEEQHGHRQREPRRERPGALPDEVVAPLQEDRGPEEREGQGRSGDERRGEREPVPAQRRRHGCEADRVEEVAPAAGPPGALLLAPEPHPELLQEDEQRDRHQVAGGGGRARQLTPHLEGPHAAPAPFEAHRSATARGEGAARAGGRRLAAWHRAPPRRELGAGLNGCLLHLLRCAGWGSPHAALGCERSVKRDALQGTQKLVHLAGFGEDGGRLDAVRPWPRADDDDRDVGHGRVPRLLLPELPAVHDRHVEIEQDDIGAVLVELAQPFSPVTRAGDHVPFRMEHCRHALAGHLVILHDKHSTHVPSQA